MAMDIYSDMNIMHVMDNGLHASELNPFCVHSRLDVMATILIYI